MIKDKIIEQFANLSVEQQLELIRQSQAIQNASVANVAIVLANGSLQQSGNATTIKQIATRN